MSKGHNKKRNVGIVYEQLVATVSRAMVESDKSSADKALKIIRKYFVPGTELYKEFRLFNALAQTQVSSEALASRILQETKEAASKYNVSKLRSEKSSLINEINASFGKDSFYNTPVKNYKLLATIHTLMEEWRKDYPDVVKRIQYESRLQDWLLETKPNNTIESQKTPEVSNLTVNIMREAFNKKFSKVLNERQRTLLKSLVFDSDGNAISKEKISRKILEHRDTAKKLLSEYSFRCESQHVKAKIPDVLKLLESLDVSDTADKNIAKVLTVIQLCDELMESKND